MQPKNTSRSQCTGLDEIHELAAQSIEANLLGTMILYGSISRFEGDIPFFQTVRYHVKLRAENVNTGPQRKRKMRFREVMDKELAHGAVWLTNEVEWAFGEPQGEHICYAYFEEA
ncbi:hypothetical protein [Pseudomonas fluorescens]|uniref:hypothetical protein n=1 Tax=Pseudomonas fluorescens TaxID=294 RepID=UPI0038042031